MQHSAINEDPLAPLTLTLVRHSRVKGDVPDEIIQKVIKELRATLTIRSLHHLCTACGLRRGQPSAALLAFAVQNSIPSLVGLPMDNPNAGFYIDIAKRYFRRPDLNIEVRSSVYDTMALMGKFSTTELDRPFQYGWPTGWAYFTHTIIRETAKITNTHVGREFVTGLALEWRARFSVKKPDDRRYVDFWDELISILEHGFILRYREMCTGRFGSLVYDYKTDEHL